MFGLGSTVPDEWKYVSLGMGNHLIVAASAYDEFKELTKDVQRVSELYGRWYETALKITRNEKEITKMSECTHDCSTCGADCASRQPESLIENLNESNLCRTQIEVSIDDNIEYFLNDNYPLHLCNLKDLDILFFHHYLNLRLFLFAKIYQFEKNHTI